MPTSLLLCFCAIISLVASVSAQQPRAFFVFGDSLVDSDLISLELGLEPTLPYLSPFLVGEKLLIGANFASAGIGILNDTGFQFLHIIESTNN
ncbi:unnamed protein product [Vicia faba]|uniref:GDSL esterase/lipase n=1 Tax=Vicia faba TaxID=3906 RepID=A0AAV0YAC1_VICFA|nr:unnamed protein product [Vicia faba]